MTPITPLSGRIIGGRDAQDESIAIIAGQDVVGLPVINAVGESLGHIQEVLIDVPSGRVAYAVLELSGLLEVGEKLFAVPWIAMTLDADNHCFILNIDKRRLKDAPCFDKERRPSLAESEWAEEVHRFFSAEPFWRYHA